MGPELQAQLDIDPGGGLVEHQDRRVVDHGLGHHEAPSHAAGEGAGIGVRLVAQAEGGQDLVGAPLARRHAIEPCLQLQELARGEEGVDVELLGHDPDGRARLARVFVDVVAPDGGLAAGLVDQARQDVDQGRLAGPVGAEQAEQGAARDFQIHVDQRVRRFALADGPVDLVEALDLDRMGGQARATGRLFHAGVVRLAAVRHRGSKNGGLNAAR